MDLSFSSLSARTDEDRAAPVLDHGLLVAAVAAQQSAIAGAGRSGGSAAPPAGEDLLATLILGDAGWREASRAQRGCFSRAEAGRRFNVR